MTNTKANAISGNKTQKLVLAALFTALTCIATSVIQIKQPFSLTEGYINLGDAFIILSALLLGPLYGGLAGGLGSMLADIFLGYMQYAPATFIIKGLAGILCGLFFKYASKKVSSAKLKVLLVIFAAVVSGVIVTSGYFLYEGAILYGYTAALTSVPGNLVQNLFGIILSTLLYPIISKIEDALLQ